jgi:hypothetical protein
MRPCPQEGKCSFARHLRPLRATAMFLSAAHLQAGLAAKRIGNRAVLLRLKQTFIFSFFPQW